MSKVEKLNTELKIQYEHNNTLESFTKYVMSEICYPIEDYINFVNLIKINCYKHISCELLIIGTHLAIQWTDSDYNELLTMLNSMMPILPNKEKSIVHYLNAYKLYFRNKKDYLTNPRYVGELKNSTELDTSFVNNYHLLAECSTGKDALYFYSYALNNVKEVFSSDESSIESMSLDDLLNPQRYIDEFILGTVMSKCCYNSMKKKCNFNEY